MSHASGERTAGDRAGSRRASGSKGSFHRNLRHIGPSLLNIKKESPNRTPGRYVYQMSIMRQRVSISVALAI